jgi:hypothetical protein
MMEQLWVTVEEYFALANDPYKCCDFAREMDSCEYSRHLRASLEAILRAQIDLDLANIDFDGADMHQILQSALRAARASVRKVREAENAHLIFASIFRERAPLTARLFDAITRRKGLSLVSIVATPGLALP